MPPPTIAAIEAEWCGARNGRRDVSRPLSSAPAIEAIIDTSSSSLGESGGRIEGSRLASIDLPAPGRPDHQHVVAARRGHLERPLRGLLTLDVGKVGEQPRRIGEPRLGPRQHLRAAEMIGDGDQAARREDRHVATGPGRLRPGRRRADQPAAHGIGGDRRGQHAGHRRDRPVEGEFAERDEIGELVARQGAERRHQPERDRQVVVAAFLGQVGRREVDDDPPRRQRQAAGVERAP